MSDLQWLFLVLAALYGWECACWIRRGTVAFTTWLGRDWHEAHPGTLFVNQRGGFVLPLLSGVMEYWSVGILSPTLHYSITPFPPLPT